MFVTDKCSDNTETLRDMGLDRERISLASGRNSEIRPAAVSGDDTETTFVFTVPPRDVSELQESEQADESLARVEDEVPYEAPYDVPDDVPDEEDDEVDNIDFEDPDLASSPQPAYLDISLQDTTLQEGDLASAVKPKAARKKRMKISKHGIQYPSLPAGVVKKLATSYARMGGNSKAKISKDTLDAIMQASDWFFEQVSDDLGAYAKHAGRKTIDESDIVTLMARFVFPFPLNYTGALTHFCTQATPDKCHYDTIFSCSKAFTPRAASRSTNGASIKAQERPTAAKSGRGSRGMMRDFLGLRCPQRQIIATSLKIGRI